MSLMKVQHQWTEGPGLKGHGKKLRHNTMKRAHERLLVKVQSRCFKGRQHFWDTSTMEWPPRTATAMEWRHLETLRQTLCTEEDRSPIMIQGLFRSPEIVSRSQITGHCIYTVGPWFCFLQLGPMPWFFFSFEEDFNFDLKGLTAERRTLKVILSFKLVESSMCLNVSRLWDFKNYIWF